MTTQTYIGDGYQKSFAFSFPYLSPLHVKVFVNGTLQLIPLSYRLVGSQIVFNDAPAVDAAIEIKRQSAPNDVLVDFTDGSTLKADELDTAYLHNLYLSQEYSESFSKLINDALVGIATGGGIVITEPDAVIAELVQKLLEDASAAELLQRINDIDANAEAILDIGSTLQIQINTLAQGVAASVFVQNDAPVAGVAGVPNPIPEGARWYDADDNNKPYIYLSGVWTTIDDPRVGVIESDLTVLTATVGGNSSAIVDESFARTTADTAFSQTLGLLGAETDAGAAFLIDLDTTKVGPTETLANRLTTLRADVDGNAASVSNEITARATADTALASDITAVTATANGNTASVGILSTAATAVINDLAVVQARYGVSLDVNGYVSGFVQNNDGVSGSFVVSADRFAIVSPTGGSGQAGLVPFEVAAGKINIRSDVAIDGSLMVNGTILGGAIGSGAIGSGNIGTGAITTDKIGANAITAIKIDAATITADKLAVNNLAAITADMGSITAGDITMDTLGYIRGGAGVFADATTKGFWLGYDAGDYKFSIGDFSSGNFMKWDGDTLTIQGDLVVGNYISSDNVLMYAGVEREITNKFSFSKAKEFRINRAGSVRLAFLAKRGPDQGGTPLQNPLYSIWKNGVQVGLSVTVQDYAYTLNTIDVTGLAVNDLIEIKGRAGEDNAAGGNQYDVSIFIDEVYVGADVHIPADGGTILYD